VSGIHVNPQGEREQRCGSCGRWTPSATVRPVTRGAFVIQAGACCADNPAKLAAEFGRMPAELLAATRRAR